MNCDCRQVNLLHVEAVSVDPCRRYGTLGQDFKGPKLSACI